MLSKSTIKYIQSLQQKKFRDEYNVFVAEGPKVVTELLESNIFPCQGIYATESYYSDKSLDSLKKDDRLQLINDIEIGRISGLQTPHEVVAVFQKRMPQKIVAKPDTLTLVLDDLRDPGNLGTIIRSADWFGITSIVCSLETVEMYNPKVVQSTMASLGRVNIAYANLLEWLPEQKGVRKYAAVRDGKSSKMDLKAKKGILIIGNEARGIHPSLLELADEKISIKGSGKAESLNAAVAAAILLYAFSD